MSRIPLINEASRKITRTIDDVALKYNLSNTEKYRILLFYMEKEMMQTIKEENSRNETTF